MTTTTSTDPYSSTDTSTSGSTSGSATEEGRRVAGVAKNEAGQVAAEARDQVAELLEEAKSQLSEQGSTQRDRLVATLTTLGDDLEHMAQQSDRSGMATDLARQAAGRVRDLGNRLDGREPSQILDDVRAFARRRPGTFLLGAVAAGVLAGRLTRGAKESRPSESNQTPQPSSGTVGHETTPGVHAATANGSQTGSGSGSGIEGATAAPGEPIVGSEAPLTSEAGGLDNGLPQDRGAL